MIKLIDDIELLERLSEKEPYFGSIFTATAVSFMDDPELLSIWVEIDENGRAHSFLNASAEALTLFSPYGIPGFEMVLFVTNLISGGEIKYIDCDENSLSVLENLIDFEMTVNVQMSVKNRIDITKNSFDIHSSENFDEAWNIVTNSFPSFDSSGEEFWKLKMVQGVLKKQSTLLTLCENGNAVSFACIRGRSKNSAAITSVSTLPNHRNRGYASYLTALCTNMLIDEHRTPWLVPQNPDIQKMYEKIGYKAVKNYYSLYNIKEKETEK